MPFQGHPGPRPLHATCQWTWNPTWPGKVSPGEPTTQAHSKTGGFQKGGYISKKQGKRGVWWSGVLLEMSNYNCDENICNTLSSNLSNQNPPICRCRSYWKRRISCQLYVRFSGVELIVESLYVYINIYIIYIYVHYNLDPWSFNVSAPPGRLFFVFPSQDNGWFFELTPKNPDSSLE